MFRLSVNEIYFTVDYSFGHLNCETFFNWTILSVARICSYYFPVKIRPL
jgi:hypothetical protein